MARFEVGDVYASRARRLEAPALADKMVRRAVSRREISALLVAGEVIEVYEHESRVRYVLFADVRGRPLHLVVAEDDILDATVVLSVYEPDEHHGWDPASRFRSRKEGC